VGNSAERFVNFARYARQCLPGTAVRARTNMDRAPCTRRRNERICTSFNWSAPCFRIIGSLRVKSVAVAATSASAANTTTAEAVAGAHTHSHKNGKGKTDFSDALSAILSGQSVQQQTKTAQDDSADAAKIKSMNSAAADASTQAKLVSALANAANAPPKIVGSDGKTSASSNSDGTQADAQSSQTHSAQTETSADVANVLAAMQKAKPVVTTIQPNADETAAAVTSRTMPQLEKAALDNTAQQAIHSAAPAEKTEAQALALPANDKSANSSGDSGAQTGSDQKQSQNSDSSRLTASAAKTSDAQAQPATVSDAPPAASNPTPVTQATTSTGIANAATAVGNTAPAQAGTTAPTTIATTLQVAQQTATSSATPDLSALAISIAAKSKDGQNEFNIRMEPAELGRVDVRLSVDAAGKAQAHLTADKPQTLEMLQRDSHTLERSLKDSGLDLSNNGLNFSLKGQQQNSSPTFTARNRALSINTVQATDTASSSSTSTAPGDSRLDIRV
jgi:flagellar hook-length control protein FliK